MSQELNLDLRGVEMTGAPGFKRGTASRLRMESRLSPGCHAVVVQSPKQADSLILTCAGLQKALRGRPKIAGKNPYSSPRTRAQIVSLLAHELETDDFRDSESVAHVVEQLTEATGSTLGEKSGAKRALEHLTSLKNRSFSSLSNDERRTVMLELALSHPAPHLALLYEPWSVIADPDYPEQRLLSEVRRLVRQGCVVVLLTVSEQQGERYSPRLIHPSLEYSRGSFSSRGGQR